MTVLHPRSNAAVYTLVATGECELTFARIDRAPSDVHTVELGAESLAVLLPPGTDPHPNQAHLTPAQVCALPLILPSAGNPTRVALDQFFTTHGAHLSAVIENDDYDSTLELARCGVGACLTTLTAPRVPRGTRVKAIYPPHETKIGLVYQHGKLDPAAAAFLRLTLAEFNGHRRPLCIVSKKFLGLREAWPVNWISHTTSDQGTANDGVRSTHISHRL